MKIYEESEDFASCAWTPLFSDKAELRQILLWTANKDMNLARCQNRHIPFIVLNLDCWRCCCIALYKATFYWEAYAIYIFLVILYMHLGLYSRTKEIWSSEAWGLSPVESEFRIDSVENRALRLVSIEACKKRMETGGAGVVVCGPATQSARSVQRPGKLLYRSVLEVSKYYRSKIFIYLKVKSPGCRRPPCMQTTYLGYN